MNKFDWISDLVKSILLSIGGLAGCIYVLTRPECNHSALTPFVLIAGVGLWWFGFLIGCGYEKEEEDEDE